jgi:CRP-like cAMP-binding protein
VKGDCVEIKELLRGVELFDGLTDDDLSEVATICTRRKLKEGEVLAKQGEVGRELFIVSEGLVEVTVSERTVPRVVVNLGTGQLIGEMSLVDRGPRSATVKAIHDPTYVQVIQHDDFQALCQRNTQIGYRVMLNLAADLSFKLRHRHLSED